MRRKFKKHALLAPQLVFCIGFYQCGEQVTAESKSRLKHVRHELFIRTRVHVLQINSAVLDMIFEVEVSTIRKTSNFVELVRIFKMEVHRALAVVRALSVGNLDFLNITFLKTQECKPSVHLPEPVLKLFCPRFFLKKILKFHNLQLPHTENEVARSDFIAERAANLRDAEREFRMIRVYDVLKIDEHALCGLGPQVDGRVGTVYRTDGRFKHHIELSRLGKCALALRTLGDIVKMVGTETSFALLALHQRVAESAHVPARLPHLWVHQNRRVDAVHVVARVDKVAPPQIFYILLQCHAKRSIVPRAGESAVSLGPLVHKPAPLAQRHYFFHHSFFVHNVLLLYCLACPVASFALLSGGDNVHTVRKALLA